MSSIIETDNVKISNNETSNIKTSLTRFAEQPLSLPTTQSPAHQNASYHWQCIDGSSKLQVSLSQLNAQASLPAIRPRVTISDAKTGKDASEQLLAAQRLRTDCFSASFGVTFAHGLDVDAYDDACLHLLISHQQQVIATARVLDSQRAAQIGGFYSESEFYLPSWLQHYPYNILEVGRTCIHPDYRNGQVLRLLWQAIAEVAKALKVNAFMGCCSIPLGAGDVNEWLKRQDQLRKLAIRPKYPVPPSLLSAELSLGCAPSKRSSHSNNSLQTNQPNPALQAGMTASPLLHSYIKMGASVSEQACFDVDFHCADILLWLPFEQVTPRYQHLL